MTAIPVVTQANPHPIRSTLRFVLSLLVIASTAGAQSAGLVTVKGASVVVKTERLSFKTADGRSGWVDFDIIGEVDGRARGRMRMSLADLRSPAAVTDYAVVHVTVNANDSHYEFAMRGTAREQGSRAARQFTSRLKLAKAPRDAHRAAFNPKELSLEKSVPWQHFVIDELTCEIEGTVIKVCY